MAVRECANCAALMKRRRWRSDAPMNRHAKFRFQLYVAGDAPNSIAAVSNLHAYCERCLSGRYSIEIIDVFREPKRALKDGIFMTPTLVRTLPGPVQRIVGSLSHAQPVLRIMGWIEGSAT